MERIICRKTLDVHKGGIQFTLQGFTTSDNLSRRLEISFMASGDTVDFPLENTVAMIYVTTPSAQEPSIEKCEIKDNKIIYNMLPIIEEGITEMQIKVIGTSVSGTKSVLGAPKFAIEVEKSNTDDEGAEQKPSFTALEDAVAHLPQYMARVSALRDKVIAELSKIPYSFLNGSAEKRLPNNVNMCFEGIEGESLLLMLDMFGIAASSGSACTSGSLDPSHVLLAIGLPHEIAHGSLRLSFSELTTEEEADYIIEKVPGVVERLRQMSPVWENMMKENA